MRKILPLSMTFSLLFLIGLAQAYVPYEDNLLSNPSFEIDGYWGVTDSSYSTAWSQYGVRSMQLGLNGYINKTMQIFPNAFIETCVSYKVRCAGHGAPYSSSILRVTLNGTTIASWSWTGSTVENIWYGEMECQQSIAFRGSGTYPELYEFKFKNEMVVGSCDIWLDGTSLVQIEHIKNDEVYCTPSGVTEGTTVSINNEVVNWRDGSPYTYFLGYTYGVMQKTWDELPDKVNGWYVVWADPDYNSGYFRDGYGEWRNLTMNQYEQKALSRTMLFTYDYFEHTGDTTPDVFLSVRDPDLNIMSYWVKRNCFTGYQSTWKLTQTSHQECYGGDCTPPIYPAFGANFTLGKCFRNDGGASHTFHIRTRIGNESVGWCNQDCIRDGMGVYVNETIGAGDVHCIVRTFTPPVWSDPTKFYNVKWEVFDDNYELVQAWTHENVWQPSGVAPPPPFAYAHAVSVNATWVRYGSPFSPDYLAVTGFILNNGSYGGTFTLGMSIGEWCVPQGVYTSVQEWYPCGGEEPCNVDCYRDGLGNWTYKYIPAGESASFTRVFAVPDYFDIGEWFDVAVGVWNITYPYDEVGLVSWSLFDNKTRVVLIPPPPPPPVGVDAEIVKWNFSDTKPLIDDEVTIKIWIRNTGNVSYNFPVGLSIGNESSMIYCNRDCYTDGKGNYVYTGTMYVGETRVVQRTFKFYDDWFDVHEYYDVRMGVYHAEDIPYDEALGKKTLNDYVYISDIEDKLNAYAISARAIPYQNTRKGLVSIETNIKNAGKITWNYTLGMSIGLFDAVNGQVYTSHRPELLPPCNTYCYVDCEEYEDNLCLYPQWKFAYIPPNYTMPFERKFRIPDYFIPNSSFDVAVGVWSKPPEEGGRLVTIVYFKNISFVGSELAPEVKYGEVAKQYLDKGYVFMKSFLGWEIPTVNMITWLMLTMILTVVTAYYTREAKIGSATPTFLVFIILLIAGAVTKLSGQPFLPPWIPVVLIIVSGFVWAKFIGLIGK